MYWADSIGARRIHTKLSEWEVKYGQFFKPCKYLAKRAAGGVPLVRRMTWHTAVWFFLDISIQLFS
jgi:enoyl-CoA hydratase/3-hydroxyacyl-CoA dehydrogenase